MATLRVDPFARKRALRQVAFREAAPAEPALCNLFRARTIYVL